METTIKSMSPIIRNNKVQLRLRLNNGVEKFAEMKTHTLNSAAVVVETLKRDSVKHGDNIIFDFFK